MTPTERIAMDVAACLEDGLLPYTSKYRDMHVALIIHLGKIEIELRGEPGGDVFVLRFGQTA